MVKNLESWIKKSSHVYAGVVVEMYLLNRFGEPGKQVTDLLLTTGIILLQQLLVQPVGVAHTWNRIGNLGMGERRHGCMALRVQLTPCIAAGMVMIF